MSLLDTQAFVQELLRRFDPNMDTATGSRADSQIIQPLLRRLGSDPFAVDVRAFLMDRLNQEFPETAIKDGDAVTDLLVKPSELLFDPLVRENTRVRQNLSFRNPDGLSVEEAEALGANFFVPRQKGAFAKGQARLYFPAPQGVSISPVNVCTTRGGLGFFPESTQSISVEEMLLNQEGDLYYFDINLSAEAPGDQYNIEPDEVVAIQGLASAVRVVNKRRFRSGVRAEDAVQYLARVEQDITERSMVTKRGVVAQTMRAFPDVTRLNVVGHGDPEMRRDVVTGGGLGPIKAAGRFGFSVVDGSAQPKTRRFRVDPGLDPVDFTSIIGPSGASARGYFLVLHGTYYGIPPVKDFELLRVVSPTEVDLVDQALSINAPDNANIVWELRRRELTLSNIPGGLLFPDGPNGTVTVPDGQIHVGGATDVYLRSTKPETASLAIAQATDDEPILSGRKAFAVGNTLVLGDFILPPNPGANYVVGDDTYNVLLNMQKSQYTIQILDGVGAGFYYVSVPTTWDANGSPAFGVFGGVPTFSNARWRIVDLLNIDVYDPKETLGVGTDLVTAQLSKVVTTQSGGSFDDLGVAVGDTLRIESGKDKADYAIKELAPFPSHTRLVLDRALTASASNVKYVVFRPNPAGGAHRPLLRVTGVELLDNGNQPTGSKVPYAKPIGAYSSAFSNPAHGVKIDYADFLLGVVGVPVPGSGLNLDGRVLQIRLGVYLTAPVVTITFAGNGLSLSTIIQQINTQANQTLAVAIGDRLGIIPAAYGGVQLIGGTASATSALPLLFGGMLFLDSKMLRSPTIDLQPDFLYLRVKPPIDKAYDVIQVVSGNQLGVYNIQSMHPFSGELAPSFPLGLTLPGCLRTNVGLAPEANVHVLLGARSLGKATLYFLEPTTFEVTQDTRFTATVDGAELEYIPDPALSAQIIPPKPGGAKPKDAIVAYMGVGQQGVVTSAGTNFVRKRVLPGDSVVLDYIPILGTHVLTDPVVGLAFKSLRLVFESGVEKVVTFVNDSSEIAQTDVTQAGVAKQINAQIGKQIAKLAADKLELEPDVFLLLKGTGTANALLKLPVVDVNNVAKFAGTFKITQVFPNSLRTEPLPQLPNESRVQFKIHRPSSQRMGTTEMSQQLGPAGLYTADIELVSVGTGDGYNLSADVPMTLRGYKSDGYYLTTRDPKLSFSMVEDVTLCISPTVNEVGTDDNKETATTISGRGLSVRYERSTAVENEQSFLSADLDRVVCASTLARHLIPHFLRFDLTYSGVPKESEVRPEIETLIHSTFPDRQIEVSDITAILSLRGADSVSNPVTLYGVVYEEDRSVRLEKSQDRINVGRLAAFFPDRLNITRGLL